MSTKKEQPITFKIYPQTHALLIDAHLAEMARLGKAMSFISFCDSILRKGLSAKKSKKIVKNN